MVVVKSYRREKRRMEWDYERQLAASNWISTTCRDIQTAIIKTCAYNNRFALKCAFGESYNDLYPGTIYSPPSYDVRFPSAIMSS